MKSFTLDLSTYALVGFQIISWVCMEVSHDSIGVPLPKIALKGKPRWPDLF
jgi:hypothetical protein